VENVQLLLKFAIDQLPYSLKTTVPVLACRWLSRSLLKEEEKWA